MALKAVAAPLGSPVGGSGTTNTIPRWTGASTLGDSGLVDDSTSIYTSTRRVGVDTSTTLANVKLQVGTAASLANYQGAPLGVVLPAGSGSWLEFAENSASGTSFRISKDSTTGVVINTNGKAIGFTAAGYTTAVASSQMVLTTGGNVGIGTASPGAQLDVVGTAVVVRARASSTNTTPVLGAEPGMTLRNANSTVGNYTSITNRDSNDNANGQINFINVNHTGSGAINFVTRDSVSGSGERARIDSAGNFGIGVIPSAWASSVRAEEMRTHARWNYNSGSDSVAYWTVNAFLNSAGNAIYKATAAASQYTQIGGAHVWERAVSGTAGNTVTWLESARIDSSGNLLMAGNGTAANPIIANSTGVSGMYFPSAATVAIAANGAIAATFSKVAGAGVALGGTTGLVFDASGNQQGIKLRATPDSTDTQTLDCYQDGGASAGGLSWTPTLSAAATWGGTAPTVTNARYTRVGNLVFCTVTLDATGAVAFSSTYGSSTISSPAGLSAAASTTVPSNRAGASANGAQGGTTVYVPTYASNTTVINLTWFFAV